MKRVEVIHILGASGSGVTTLGQTIEKHYGYRQLDVDNYFWMPTDPPFTTKRERQERIELLKKDINKYKKCTLSGSLCGWGDELVPYFDLIIRVITPEAVRIKRLRAREYQNFGDRILHGGDMHKEHEAFIEWASRYDDGGLDMRSKRTHDKWLQGIECNVISVDGTWPMEKMIGCIDKVLKRGENDDF